MMMDWENVMIEMNKTNHNLMIEMNKTNEESSKRILTEMNARNIENTEKLS